MVQIVRRGTLGWLEVKPAVLVPLQKILTSYYRTCTLPVYFSDVVLEYYSVLKPPESRVQAITAVHGRRFE